MAEILQSFQFPSSRESLKNSAQGGPNVVSGLKIAGQGTPLPQIQETNQDDRCLTTEHQESEGTSQKKSEELDNNNDKNNDSKLSASASNSQLDSSDDQIEASEMK